VTDERPPRRTRSGLLRPWVVDYMNGRAEQQRLSRELGVDLDLDPIEAHALGVAIADQGQGEAMGHGQYLHQDPTLDPGAAVALETIAAARDHNPHEDWNDRHRRHQHHRHAVNETCSESGPRTAPEPSTTDRSKVPNIRLETTNDLGRVAISAALSPEVVSGM
jgi:hypothetical protein